MTREEELLAMGIAQTINEKEEEQNKKIKLIKCEVCGKEIAENATTCPNCGAKNKNNNESASTGLKVICFLIPLIGIIIFAVNISTKPKYAKECLIASILPTIIAVVIILFIYVSVSTTTSGGVLTKYQNTSTNTNTNTSSYDSTDLPYCKYSGCYNKVSYSWNNYCDTHSYLEY